MRATKGQTHTNTAQHNSTHQYTMHTRLATCTPTHTAHKTRHTSTAPHVLARTQIHAHAKHTHAPPPSTPQIIERNTQTTRNHPGSECLKTFREIGRGVPGISPETEGGKKPAVTPPEAGPPRRKTRGTAQTGGRKFRGALGQADGVPQDKNTWHRSKTGRAPPGTKPGALRRS